jgi:hypothetical protein
MNLLLSVGMHLFNPVLLTIGAFCSGMGVGYCNIDTLELEVMQMGNDPL